MVFAVDLTRYTGWQMDVHLFMLLMFWVSSGFIKLGNWNKRTKLGFQVGKSSIDLMYFPASHVWWPEGSENHQHPSIIPLSSQTKTISSHSKPMENLYQLGRQEIPPRGFPVHKIRPLSYSSIYKTRLILVVCTCVYIYIYIHVYIFMHVCVCT